MHFFHTPDLWSAFPNLHAGVMHVRGVSGALDFEAAVAAHAAAAKIRLSGSDLHGRAPLSEGQWPEIQAWRRVYSEMGLQPTQVRCAAEALLRRLRQDGQLPKVNPLVDLCNAVSVHAAVPIAVFDCAQVAWPLSVERARGDEEFLAFSGEIEHPAEAEVACTCAQVGSSPVQLFCGEFVHRVGADRDRSLSRWCIGHRCHHTSVA